MWWLWHINWSNSTSDEINKFSKLLKKNPRNYISQPTLKFSRVPVFDK